MLKTRRAGGWDCSCTPFRVMESFLWAIAIYNTIIISCLRLMFSFCPSCPCSLSVSCLLKTHSSLLCSCSAHLSLPVCLCPGDLVAAICFCYFCCAGCFGRPFVSFVFVLVSSEVTFCPRRCCSVDFSFALHALLPVRFLTRLTLSSSLSSDGPTVEESSFVPFSPAPILLCVLIP